MASFTINIRGQEFDVEAPNEKALPEIAETIAREQSATGQASVQQQGIEPKKFTGEIREPASLKEKVKGALPGFGQFVGGIGGGAIGSVFGKPFLGSAIGGTAGRGLGLVGKRGAEQFEREPVKTLGRSLFGVPGIISGMSESERKQLGKETLKAGAVEAIAAPVGAAASAFIGNIGKNIAGALLGDRVAERGIKEGFAKILNPKNFEGRLAKDIATKASRFFERLSGVAGKGVSSQAKKDSAIFHNTDDMVVKGQQLLKRSGAVSLDDFKTSNVSKSQFNKAKEIQSLFDEIADKDRIGTFDLWNNRKAQDRIFFNTRWDDDLGRYLKGLRQITNDPLLNTSDDMTKAFGKYSFVKNSEDELGSSFTAIKSPEEIFAPKIERFAGQTLTSSKDEQIRLLKALDDILPVEDKVVEELLDAAAAEAIDKPIQLLGLPSRILAGALGGKRAIAGFGKFVQRPTTKAVTSGLGRGAVTGATELFAENE